MTQGAYQETLKNVPHILALWERVVRLSQEFPGYLLLKRTPFLISSKGRVRKYPRDGFILIPQEAAQNFSYLWAELNFIEYLISEKSLKRKELELLNRQSKRLLTRIDKLSLVATAQEFDEITKQQLPLN